MHLEVEHLSAWFDSRGRRTPVLDDVSLRIPSGALGAVLGPSGSGKSTLLRTIAGLHKDATGSIRLGETRLNGLPPERRHIGLVPQDGALFPHLTVAQNIEFGLPRARRRRSTRAAEMMELLGLGRFATRLPHQLSGGQAQRVAVARALTPQPRLLLLDEPFSALDAALRTEVRDGVRNALEATGTTAVLVTHDQGEALSMASELIILTQGQVRQCGTPFDVYTCPIDVWVGRFLGEANVYTAVTDGTTATTPLGALPHSATSPGTITVLVRPEQVHLDRTLPHRGTVVSTRYFGHDCLTTVRLDSGDTMLARLTAGSMPSDQERVSITVTGEVRTFPNTGRPRH